MYKKKSNQQGVENCSTPPLKAGERFSPVNVLFITALISLVTLVPLWSADVPPLLDYHNHLARQYILEQLPNSEILQSFYKIEWRASPYLVMDVIVQLFSRFMSVAAAGKIFLSFTLLLVALAPVALNIALFGRVTPISLVGLLFTYSTTLTLGFVNFLFSVGFALCLFSLWILKRESSYWMKLAVFSLMSTLLFFSHLIGFCIYFLLVGTFELSRHIDKYDQPTLRALLSFDSSQQVSLISLGLQCAIPLTIFFLYGPSSEGVSSNTYGDIWRKIELIVSIFSYLIPPYSWTLDRILTSGMTALVPLLLLMQKITISKQIKWSLFAMLLLFFVMPMELFSGWGADQRLLTPIGLLFVGSLTPNSGNRTIWLFITAFIAMILLVRTTVITNEWRKTNNEDYAEYFKAFESLRDGSKVYFAFGHAEKQQIWPRPVYHLPHLALKTRQVYLPYLFTTKSGTIPLQYAEDLAQLQRLSPGPVLMYGESPNWSALLNEYDFFLLVNEQYFKIPVPDELVPVYQGDKVKVYKSLDSKNRGNEWKIR